MPIAVAVTQPGYFMTLMRQLLLATSLALLAPLALAQPHKQELDQLPGQWAAHVSNGDFGELANLYLSDALLHQDFDQQELHGSKQIAEFYAGYAGHLPKIVITKINESRVMDAVGLLGGSFSITYADQHVVKGHFSLVCQWIDGKWQIEIQHNVRAKPE
ncbi:MAG TPA: hypothetical protein VMH83_04210 [Candidatus Acidoferrum sp.]|nr:hypothetical protein [Candidatus Acidoferrum sp.]